MDRSLRRLTLEVLDLVQFHWWDFGVPRHLEVLEYLFRLRRAGKIRSVGLTSWGSEQLRDVIEAGFEVESLQLQHSVVDRRCEATVMPLCKAHRIKVYAYGSLLGGFLDEKWLGQREPAPTTLGNRSLVKYKLIIDDWGGWERFQALLRQLSALARRRRCAIPQVAVGALLDAGKIDAVIVGLSPRNDPARDVALSQIPELDDEELRGVWSWHCPLPGDVCQLERTSGRHARIMR